MAGKRSWMMTALAATALAGLAAAGHAQAPATSAFQTADGCIACHTNVLTRRGEDISFDRDWRATMMANSSRDPYWQAAVRREVLRHPSASAAIQDECSACHMPMMRTDARLQGHEGTVFDHLPIAGAATPAGINAADGVSCTVCHQIRPEGLDDRSAFGGAFRIAPVTGRAPRAIYGPFAVDAGRSRLMHSASGFQPSESPHMRSSALCGGCHTLITTSLDANGAAIGTLPEQVPYLEWQHSAYRETQGCQSCHMPVVQEPVAISTVLGQPREGVARHTFRGGNFFMIRMLNRFRDELGVTAPAADLDGAARATDAFLASSSATLAVDAAARDGDVLTFDVRVSNLGGHKLPTAYPSRRVWLHVTVRDESKRTVFESGALAPDGSIRGNDNDADPLRFEPHHDVISAADQVQVYEAIMADTSGAVTTGLLSAVRYLKDNRLLPRGFDKGSAASEIAVRGDALADANFDGTGDRVRYAVPLTGAQGALEVSVALRYQPIGFRWARNLETPASDEGRRFLRYYDAMSGESAARLAEHVTRVP